LLSEVGRYQLSTTAAQKVEKSMPMFLGLRHSATTAVIAAVFLSVTALGFTAASALAQTAAPTPEQMIEQLKAPRTRSLRNLSVEPVNPNATGAANANSITPNATSIAEPKPSLSLLIQFEFNSARVSAESQQALSNLAQALKSEALASSKFAVEGHTDAKGRADYNLRLSQQRADAVASLLAAQGVGADRLQALGKGATTLANSQDPNAAENRRVRIVNLD
jgi:outer membrane protein OmpA-like peptidoglycan-associated protein